MIWFDFLHANIKKFWCNNWHETTCIKLNQNAMILFVLIMRFLMLTLWVVQGFTSAHLDMHMRVRSCANVLKMTFCGHAHLPIRTHIALMVSVRVHMHTHSYTFTPISMPSRACARLHDHSIIQCVAFACVFFFVNAFFQLLVHALMRALTHCYRNPRHRLFLSNGWCLRARTAHAAVHKPCASRPGPMCSLLGWPKPSIFRSIDPTQAHARASIAAHTDTVPPTRPGYRYFILW